MKNTSLVLTLLCTSLVWCSSQNAAEETEDGRFVLDTRPGQKLVLTEQGHAKALALQELYDQQQNQRNSSFTEPLKSTTEKPTDSDEDSELAGILGLTPEYLKLSKALHLSFEKQLDTAHLVPETNPQPKPSDIPYPVLREKKDNGPELNLSPLNDVPEINAAKEQDIKLKKVDEHTELVAQLFDEKGKAWEVYLSLIVSDPEIEALEDDEEKTKKRQAREEEKEKASENWSRLLTLHAAAEAELKELETKEASIGEDSDSELERALSASRQAHEEEQEKIAREIREAQAEEKRQAGERRAEARKVLEEEQEIRRVQKESLFSKISELDKEARRLSQESLAAILNLEPGEEKWQLRDLLQQEADEASNTITLLHREIEAFGPLDDQIQEEIIHLIRGGDPRNLPWKEEFPLILQGGASSFPSSSLPSIPSSALPKLNSDGSKDVGSGDTFL